jgi:hypothetical protein
MPIYTSRLLFDVLLYSDFEGYESKQGRGRKRERKSTRNGNMEEILILLLSPLVLEV